MPNRWLVEKATGRFLQGGFFDVALDNPATQELVTLPDERMPDTERERYDPNSPWMRRWATEDELQSEALASADALADVSARDRALLAVFGTVLKRFDPTWAAMTLAQKRAAVTAMGDDYAQIRRWVERNL